MKFINALLLAIVATVTAEDGCTVVEETVPPDFNFPAVAGDYCVLYERMVKRFGKIARPKSQSNIDDFQELCNRIDRDDNGYISVKELRKFLCKKLDNHGVNNFKTNNRCRYIAENFFDQNKDTEANDPPSLMSGVEFLRGIGLTCSNYGDKTTCEDNRRLKIELENYKGINEPVLKSDLPLFWNVPEAGVSVVKHDMEVCHGLVTGSEYEVAQVVSTPNFWDTTSIFYSSAAHAFTVMRDPVERVVSKLLHAKATQPKYESFTLDDFAEADMFESDWMTTMLSSDNVPSVHSLEAAKGILREKFLVGVHDKLEESLVRFENFFGWTHDSQCMEASMTQEMDNSSAVKEAMESMSQESLDRIASDNSLDIELYNYAQELYKEQSSLFAEETLTATVESEEQTLTATVESEEESLVAQAY